MRADPLQFLSDELDSLQAAGPLPPAARSRKRAGRARDVRSQVGRQSLVEQLSRPDDASASCARRRSKPSRKFGAGSGSVRTIAGTMDMHMELERRLAAFKNVEAVVVFQSGFAANAGTVSAILTKDDVIISDELNHASIIDGCRLESRHDQSVSAQGRRRGAQDPEGPAGDPDASCSSPTASSRWTAISGRCPSCATSPKSSAPS